MTEMSQALILSTLTWVSARSSLEDNMMSRVLQLQVHFHGLYIYPPSGSPVIRFTKA